MNAAPSFFCKKKNYTEVHKHSQPLRWIYSKKLREEVCFAGLVAGFHRCQSFLNTIPEAPQRYTDWNSFLLNLCKSVSQLAIISAFLLKCLYFKMSIYELYNFFLFCFHLSKLLTAFWVLDRNTTMFLSLLFWVD